MRPRHLMHVVSMLLLGALAGCSATRAEAPPSAAEASSPPPATPRETFQDRLDRLGVPLALPARGKAIVVNVPGFELLAFEDAEPVLRSRVIVGAPPTPTPLLVTHTTAVRFRPTWRPTPSMIATGEYRDRVWPPGPGNPLGLAAVRLAGGLLVYLHDTNRRELFAEANRARSHGCIRVQRWDELVAWILDLDLKTVDRMANEGPTRDVATAPIPVILGYYTVFPDDNGEPVHHADIYRKGGSVAPRASRGPVSPTCGETLAAGSPLSAPAVDAR